LEGLFIAAHSLIVDRKRQTRTFCRTIRYREREIEKEKSEYFFT
jgi:hypothetical protein